jgi:hypothetical protein
MNYNEFDWELEFLKSNFNQEHWHYFTLRTPTLTNPHKFWLIL